MDLEKFFPKSFFRKVDERNAVSKVNKDEEAKMKKEEAKKIAGMVYVKVFIEGHLLKPYDEKDLFRVNFSEETMQLVLGLINSENEFIVESWKDEAYSKLKEFLQKLITDNEQKGIQLNGDFKRMGEVAKVLFESFWDKEDQEIATFR